MRPWVSGLGGVVTVLGLGCHANGGSGPTTGAPPSAEPARRDDGPPAAPAPLASASAPAPASQCAAPPIYRERDLATTVKPDAACGERLARFVAGRPGDARCRSDADCTIVAAAGGCMGVGMSRAAAATAKPLERSCAPGLSCWDADFSDHHIRCREGCCSIYEE